MFKAGQLSQNEASRLNALEHRVQLLERISAGPPLFINRTAGGIVIGTTAQGTTSPPEPPHDGVFVDVVHVTARELSQATATLGKWLYTVVKVDRGNSLNNLQESTPRVVYTGVFEAQNRLAVIDPPPPSGPANVTHELPLFLDSKGRYFFQIDQYTYGSSLPDEPIVPGSSQRFPTEFEYDGHVSTSDQVLGDGVKGIRRAARVNLSRNTADGVVYPRGTTALTVLTDFDAPTQHAMRVYPHGLLLNTNIPSGVAIGSTPINGENLTGQYPLTVDGSVFGGAMVYRTAPSIDNAWHAGGSGVQTLTFQGVDYGNVFGSIGGNLLVGGPSGSFLGAQGGFYNYAYSVNAVALGTPPDVTPGNLGVTFGLYGGTANQSSSYAVTDRGQFCRGIEHYNLILATPNGGSVLVGIRGGLWNFLSFPDVTGGFGGGVIISGNANPVGGVGGAAGGVGIGASAGDGIGIPTYTNPSIPPEGGAAVVGGGMVDFPSGPIP